MRHEDIETMIANALESIEERGEATGGIRPLAHERHILDQYVALCGEEGRQEAASAEVAILITPGGPATAVVRTSAISSLLSWVLARVKR